MAVVNPGKPIITSLDFLADDPKHITEKLFAIHYLPHDPLPDQNYSLEAVNGLEIHDVRPTKDDLSLDREGVTVINLGNELTYHDYFDEAKVKARFAEEVRDILLRKLGARQIYFHECVIRKRKEPLPDGTIPVGREIEPNTKLRYGQPIKFAHGDYTIDTVKDLLKDFCGEKAEEKLERRYQALNVWKPLKGPLKDWPLAWCDLQTLDAEQDMVRIDDVYLTGIVEGYRVYHNPKQKWCYLSNQLASEAIVFKSADSQCFGSVPHAAFLNPDCPDDEDRRESIELRVFALY